MNAKLTLSIDSKVIASAKRVSKKRGQSISRMVEDYLKNVAASSHSGKTKRSILELRGMGGSVPNNFDYKKELADYLSEKYK
ncbi:MAG: DUF6364 family protein [Cyclobacteriaceae bacterium]|nr:DUF6364 family protein [Cyclobacteriaceae bacterium]